jgi:hypothetical protein
VLEQQKPDHKSRLDPGAALIAVQRRDLPVDEFPVNPARRCTSSCFILMIWSSRARNKSPDPVVSCLFGRIVPSDAATQSRSSIRGNPKPRLQAFRASGLETLQSQIRKIVRKRLSLSRLELVHGRLFDSVTRSARFRVRPPSSSPPSSSPPSSSPPSSSPPSSFLPQAKQTRAAGYVSKGKLRPFARYGPRI